MVKVPWFGLTEQSIKDSGKWEERQAKEYLLTLRARFMMGTGSTTKHKDSEFTLTLTVHDMKGSGNRIFSLEMARSFGLMDLSSKENIEMERKMELGSMCGQMEPNIMESGKIMK